MNRLLFPTMRLGALLILPVAALLTTSQVVAHGGPGSSIGGCGPGAMGGGHGPGMMGGGYGSGMMGGGYGPGMMGGGYGPGMMGGGYGPGMMGGGYGPGMMGGDDTPALLGRLGWLGLSDAQRERILSVQEEHLATVGPLRERLLEERRAIDEALHEDDPDVELVGERYGTLLDAERRLFEARLRRDDAIHDLLDEKQRNLLERLSP